MKTRITQLFKARSVELFDFFIKELKCSNVRKPILIDSEQSQIIYAFEYKGSSENLLKTIRMFFPLSHSYQKGECFVVSVPADQLLSLTLEYYKKLVNQLMETHQLKYFKSYFDGLKFNLVDENEYNRLYHHPKYSELVKTGLCIRHEDDLVSHRSAHFDASPINIDGTPIFHLNESLTFQRQQEWFIEINFTYTFAQNTIFRDLHDFLLLEQEKQQRKAFLMGTHAKMGEQSSVLPYAKSSIFEKKTLGIIFDFFQKPVTTKAAKKVLGYRHMIFDSDEKSEAKNQDSDFLILIKNQIKKLSEEISSSFPYPDSEIKQIKINFLNLILLFHELHPSFSIKQCLQCAQQEAPKLFEQAQAGSASNRTKQILDQILNEREALSKNLKK